MKPQRAGVTAALLLVVASVASAGNTDLKPMTLFSGANTDSTEQVSPWIPIRGASRVYLRTWSAKAAFHASTDADSIYSDSIAVFKVAFTDSLSNTNPAIAGDSTVITSTIVTNTDTTTTMIGVSNPPLQEALRGPGNGSGIITTIWPTVPGLTTLDVTGVFAKRYMRVYVTPLRRMTVTGGQSTAGKRVVGLKGFRMMGLVLRTNQ